MTRPIYEPNTQRTEAFLDFGQQQLFRRPSPISAGGNELPTAVMQCSDVITIADDTYTTLDADITGVEWTDGYINQAGLDMTPAGFDFDFHNGLITFSSSGVYIAQLQINWCDTFPSTGTYIMQDLIYFGNCAVTGNCGSWQETSIIPNNDAQWQHGYYHSEGHWISEENFPILSTIKGAVQQISGTGDKDICTATLIITRLCPFDRNSGEFLPPSS